MTILRARMTKQRRFDDVATPVKDAGGYKQIPGSWP
jgi:hypothetical protein